MVTVTTIGTNTVAFGTVLDDSGNPLQGVLVQLYYEDNDIEMWDTNTDENGFWSILEPTSLWNVGLWEARYYGGGLDEQLAPLGSWDLFEITGLMTGTGIGITYRGLWQPNTYYNGNGNLRDIVLVQPPNVVTAEYFSCLTNHTSAATWGLDSLDWNTFSNQFASVATDILFAQDVAVGRTISLGTDALGTGNFGILRSAAATGFLNGNGFWLAGTANGAGQLRIGAVQAGVLVSGLMWDGNSFSIMASNFQLTPAGTLWANAGGFGGTVTSPGVSLITTGMTVYDPLNGVPRVYIDNPTTGIDAEGFRITSQLGTEWVHNGTFGSDLNGWTINQVAGGTVQQSSFAPTGSPGSMQFLMSSTPAAGTAHYEIYNIDRDASFSFSWTSMAYGSLNQATLTLNYQTNGQGWHQLFTTSLPPYNGYFPRWVMGSYTFFTASGTGAGTLPVDNGGEIDIQIYFNVNQGYPAPATASLYVTNISLTDYSYFAELNPAGLYVFNSPTSYIKIGKGHFDIVGQNISPSSLTLNSLTGVLYIQTSGIVSGGASLYNLSNVNVNNPVVGQALIYNISGIWSNATVSGTGGVGATTLEQLTDVSISSIQPNQLLSWNGSHWVNYTAPWITTITLEQINDVTIIGVSANQVLSWNGSYWTNTNLSLETLSDININSLQVNQSIIWNGSAWVNATISGGNFTGSGIGGSISPNQVAFGSSINTVEGSGVFTFDGNTLALSQTMAGAANAFSVSPTYSVGLLTAVTAALINIQGSVSNSSYILDVQDRGTSRFNITRLGQANFAGNVVIINPGIQGIQWDTGNQYVTGANSGLGAFINPGNSRYAGMYISDRFEIVTPHEILRVHRQGPVPYESTDNIGALGGILDTDASSLTQPNAIYGVYGLTNVGGKTVGPYTPNIAEGVIGQVSNIGSGTSAMAQGVQGQVIHYGTAATGTITIAAKFWAIASANVGGASGHFTNAYGVYIEDDTLGTNENAAIRFQTAGRLSWNNDTTLLRSGVGALTLGGTFLINKGTIGAPGNTGVQTGDRVVLYDDGTHKYSIGVNGGALWYQTATSAAHGWYAGTTQIAQLSSAGSFTLYGSTPSIATFNAGAYQWITSMDQSSWRINNQALGNDVFAISYVDGSAAVTSNGGLSISRRSNPDQVLYLKGGDGAGLASAVAVYNLKLDTINGAPYGNIYIRSAGASVVDFTNDQTASFYGTVQSSNFALDPINVCRGFNITGGVEIVNEIITNSLHAKAFIADIEQALAGSQIISKSVAKVGTRGGSWVNENKVVPAYASLPISSASYGGSSINISTSPYPITNYSSTDSVVITGSTSAPNINGVWRLDITGQFTGLITNPDRTAPVNIGAYTGDATLLHGSPLTLESFEGYAGMDVIVAGDTVLLRQLDRSTGGLNITPSWVAIYPPQAAIKYNSAQNLQTWGMVFLNGASNILINPGQLAIDYGVVGNGIWETVAVGPPSALYPKSPYAQVVDWATAPYIDPVIRMRLGDLTGITDTDLGISFTGLKGLYTQNAFLKGNLVVKSSIPMSLITGSIMAGNVTGTAASAIKISNTGTNGTSGFYGYDFNGTEQFALRLDGTAEIAGWTFTPTAFSKSFPSPNNYRLQANLTLSTAATSTSIYYLDSAVASTGASVRWVGIGQLFDGTSGWTQDYGLGLVTYRGGVYNRDFWISQNMEEIAGWNFNNTQFTSPNYDISGGNGIPTTAGIIINSKGWLSGPGFALGASPMSSQIAGWTFTNTQLSKIDNLYGYNQIQLLSNGTYAPSIRVLNTHTSFSVSMGQAFYNGIWQPESGFVLGNTGGSPYVQFTTNSGTNQITAQIAGWTITPTELWQQYYNSVDYYQMALDPSTASIKWAHTATSQSTFPSPNITLEAWYDSIAGIYLRIPDSRLLVGQLMSTANTGTANAIIQTGKIYTEKATSNNLSTTGASFVALGYALTDSEAPCLTLYHGLTGIGRWSISVDSTGVLGVFWGNTRKVHMGSTDTSWQAN